MFICDYLSNVLLGFPKWPRPLQPSAKRIKYKIPEMTSTSTQEYPLEYYNCSKSVKQVLGAFLVFVFFPALPSQICGPVMLIDGAFIYIWRGFSWETLPLSAAGLLTWIVPYWPHSTQGKQMGNKVRADVPHTSTDRLQTHQLCWLRTTLDPREPD